MFLHCKDRAVNSGGDRQIIIQGNGTNLAKEYLRVNNKGDRRVAL
jgi:hypothetical protein